jgi:hypothetical protein
MGIMQTELCGGLYLGVQRLFQEILHDRFWRKGSWASTSKSLKTTGWKVNIVQCQKLGKLLTVLH